MYVNRISENFDKETRIIVVQALVLSLINYCISIWGSTNKTLRDRVQKLLNFAAKVAVGGARKFDHVTPIMKELKWMSVCEKYILEKCCVMYKCVRKCYPDWYYKFSTVGDNTSSVTRQINKLHVPRTVTDSGARATTVRGPKMWNSLPFYIANSGSLYSFKSKLSKMLLDDT